jgi:VanZ family protein
MAHRAASSRADAVRYWGPVVVYMGLIFWASSQPRIALPLPSSDYVLHGAAYAVLAVLSVRAIGRGAFRGLTFAQVAGGIAIASVYGLTDEWHQLYVTGRDASALDALADFVGASLGGSVLTLRRGVPRWL